MFIHLAELLLLLLLYALNVSASPAFWSGWFTVKSNNPAFQCNPADVGRTYDNVIVEAKINKFVNEHDNTYKGGHCDFLVLNNCDLRVSGYIEAEHPLDVWPANVQFTEMIHEWSGNDIRPDNAQYGPEHEKHAFSICKPVNTLSIVTVHIGIDDVDAASANDIVNHFNCHWSPQDVGERRREAKWHTINCCTAFQREMRSTVRHELKIDIRAYNADADSEGSCPASGRI